MLKNTAGLRIAFQGDHYAFSEIAAKKYFQNEIVTQPCQSFEQVFTAVKQKKTELGIIPIENTSMGSIHRNYDLLLEDGIQIVGEVNLAIELHLIAKPGVSFSQLHSIYSHPAALEQCRQFINRHSHIEFISSYDTAGSVKWVAGQSRTDVAAIASREAAIDYGMNILIPDIEDFRENITRF
ncbi:MAG: prephenate dehydratase domain-containing protein, partial [bacterium]|nr:prephenate dehydratase domain-containing protein [bacterium]